MRITDFSIEATNKDLLKLNKVCLYDADRFKHIGYSRAKAIIDREYSFEEPSIELMKKIVKAESVGLCSDVELKVKDPIIYCFSGKSSNTFRYSIAISKEYKGNRKTDKLTVEEFKLKMELMNYAMESIIKEKACLIFPDLEADDILSMLQDKNTYIISNDKDLNQIPGLHIDHANYAVTKVSQEEAIMSLAKQLITGDSVDNIGGIKDLGPAKAAKLLSETDAKNCLNVVYREYKKKYGIIKGTDLFCEAWSLVRLRANHGAYFQEKYASAFSLLEDIKKNFLNLTH